MGVKGYCLALLPHQLPPGCVTPSVSEAFQMRDRPVSEAFQAEGLKIIDMDQCTFGVDRRQEGYEYYSYDTINE